MRVGLTYTVLEGSPLTLEEWGLLEEVTHAKVAAYIEFLERRVARLQYQNEAYQREKYDCASHCELDFDGHGGRSTPCRRCGHHELRRPGISGDEKVERFLRPVL